MGTLRDVVSRTSSLSRGGNSPQVLLINCIRLCRSTGVGKLKTVSSRGCGIIHWTESTKCMRLPLPLVKIPIKKITITIILTSSLKNNFNLAVTYFHGQSLHPRVWELCSSGPENSMYSTIPPAKPHSLLNVSLNGLTRRSINSNIHFKYR